MAAVTFDTLKFVEKLKSSGLPESQAKAISEAFKEAQGEASLATTHDIKELELKITAEISLLKWMLGFLLAGVATLIIKSFF